MLLAPYRMRGLVSMSGIVTGCGCRKTEGQKAIAASRWHSIAARELLGSPWIRFPAWSTREPLRLKTKSMESVGAPAGFRLWGSLISH